MSMVTPISRERAKQLVEEISVEHGYLNEETLSDMKPEIRRRVEEAILKKDQMIGSSVVTYGSCTPPPPPPPLPAQP